MTRSSANRGLSATSSRPPCPRAWTAGTPRGGWRRARPARLSGSCPGRSVTSRRPSGRNASAQGCSSPRARVSTRTAPATGLGVGDRGAWPCAHRGRAPADQQRWQSSRVRPTSRPLSPRRVVLMKMDSHTHQAIQRHRGKDPGAGTGMSHARTDAARCHPAVQVPTASPIGPSIGIETLRPLCAVAERLSETLCPRGGRPITSPRRNAALRPRRRMPPSTSRGWPTSPFRRSAPSQI